jgi:putative hydrolase of the HAD superfamily
MSFALFRILSFDLMGTLINYEAGILDYIRGVGGAAPAALSDKDILESCARADERQREITPGVPFTKMLGPIYGLMAAELRLPDKGGEAAGFRDSVPRWPAFPDSVEAMKRLRARYRLVALTNADKWALAQMTRTLGEPFHDTVTAEDVGVNKPDPQMFAYCRGRQSVHGYGLADFLHVAQSQYDDIGVAKRLGFSTCWIERRRGKEGFGATPVPDKVTKPDYHFATLAELADAVEAES